RTATTWPGGTKRPARPGWRRCPRARKAPVACPAGSSACTPLPPTSSPCREPTRWAGRPSRPRAPGGRRGRVWTRRAPGRPARGQTIERGRQLRVAGIDCGTNSLRLLVADVDPAAGSLTDVDRRLELVRLGQGVDATGRLAPEALARTLRGLRSYGGSIGTARASAGRMGATGAAGEAANGGELVGGVHGVLGVEPGVLSGEEEARLSFTGATAELAGRVAAPCLVTDIGGGSTEFVLGDPTRPA